jgi:outer membrane protein assembly factor BamB
MAIELGHEGDLTNSDAVVWKNRKVGSNVPTPLAYDGRLYVFRGYSAQLTCFNAKTGEVLFNREKVDGLDQVYASPIAVNEHIYIPGRNGATAVIRGRSDTLEVVAVNQLDEVLDGSPVVIGDTLYLRGRSHLYAIESN